MMKSKRAILHTKNNPISQKALIHIRRARVGDVPAIVALAQVRDGAKKKWSQGRRTGFTLQLRHIVAANPNHCCWVAVDDHKKVVGYAFASFTYSPIDDGMWLHITELYVRPRMRGAGVGQRLMTTIKRASKKCKVRGLWLVVHPNNTDAQRFYRRHNMALRTMKNCFWAA